MAFPQNLRTDYSMHLKKIVSIGCKTPFTWKYFANSHRKGIVDGIGGRPKSLVQQKVMWKSKGCLMSKIQKNLLQLQKH